MISDMILAQVPTLTPSGLAIVVAGVLLVLSVASSITSIWVNVRRKPPLEAEFVSQVDCQRQHESVISRITRLEHQQHLGVEQGAFIDFQREMSQHLEKIRDKTEQNFTNVIARLSEMQAELNASAERRAAEVHSRINEDRDRISRLEGRATRVDRAHG